MYGNDKYQIQERIYHYKEGKGLAIRKRPKRNFGWICIFPLGKPVLETQSCSLEYSLHIFVCLNNSK